MFSHCIYKLGICTSLLCLLRISFHLSGFYFQSAIWFSLTFFPRHRCLHPSYLRTRICVYFVSLLLTLQHRRYMKQTEANDTLPTWVLTLFVMMYCGKSRLKQFSWRQISNEYQSSKSNFTVESGPRKLPHLTAKRFWDMAVYGRWFHLHRTWLSVETVARKTP